MQTSRRDGLNQIHYPNTVSEFEVQATLWQRLKEHGLDVVGCVSAWCDDCGPRRTYLDLVVFNDSKQAVVIVECKNTSTGFTLNASSRQLRRYSKFGIPLVKCPNYESIEDSIKLVLDKL